MNDAENCSRFNTNYKHPDVGDSHDAICSIFVLDSINEQEVFCLTFKWTKFPRHCLALALGL